VPVVSADVAGVRDYLEHGRNGMLVDSTRLASVAGTVLWALDHPAETARMAAEARRIVDREYRWETTVERTEALYRGAAR
jgi:glycosyltransferase involved in cell wall biosynthesis